MNTKHVFKTLITIVVISLGSTQSAFSAGENPSSLQKGTSSHIEINKTSVSYADLNLENEESVQVLYRRLQRASRKVCVFPSLSSIRSLQVLAEYKQCYRVTLDEAEEKINNVDLISIHTG